LILIETSLQYYLTNKNLRMFKKQWCFAFRKIWMLIVLQLVCFVGFAQYSVKGKVTDQNGNALVGATVVVKGSYLGTVADANGFYEFSDLKGGDYVLRASFLGYETKEVRINVKAAKLVDFQLEGSAILTDEVIVAATRAGSKAPVAVTNLSGDDVRRQNTGQDIPYQLSLTPSLVESSEAGNGVGYSKLSIRGTDATRINVTINGVPLNDSESQGVFWVNMPDFASSVDNIQIQRGVGTSTNGAAAFGATINFQTETVNAKPYAEVQSLAGSFNTFRNTFKAGTGLINGKFAFDARYSKLKSDGFVDRAFSDHESFFVSGTYYTEKSMLKFNVISGDQKTGISWWGNDNIEKNGRRYNPAGKYKDEKGVTHFYDNQTDNYKQTHYQLFYSQEVNPYLNLNAALHYTKGKGYYEQYKQDEGYGEYGLTNSKFKETDLIRQKWLKNDFYGFTYSMNYKKDRLNASFGGAWNRYEGDHFGEVIWVQNGGIAKNYRWYFNKGEKIDYNMFAKANIELNDFVNVYGDMQYRHITYEMDGKDDDLKPLVQEHKFDFFNPKAGLFFTIDKQTTAYASFGLAHREPTRANYKDAKGDPSSYPQAETLYDYEFGFDKKMKNAVVGVNLYYMFYRDQLVATGERNNVGASIMTNVDKSYRLGLELIGGIQITSNLKWDANLTLSRNKIKNFVDNVAIVDAKGKRVRVEARNLGTTDISYSPEIIGSSVVSWMPLKDLNISFISKYVGEQYFDNTSNDDRKIDDYFLSNLRFNYELKMKQIKSLAFSLQINNLFDKEYSNNASGSHYEKLDGSVGNWAAYFPQAGTNFMAGVSLRF